MLGLVTCCSAFGAVETEILGMLGVEERCIGPDEFKPIDSVLPLRGEGSGVLEAAMVGIEKLDPARKAGIAFVWISPVAQGETWEYIDCF